MVVHIQLLVLLSVVGYDRDIPGFPRYRMIGSVTHGEHHLVIESAQLSDDANFQCQVTPAGGDPPLASSARLSVIGESNRCIYYIPGFPHLHSQ